MTKEDLEELLRYEPETGYFFWVSGQLAGSRAGTLTSQGYIRIKIRQKLYRAHRLAWLIVHGSMPSIEIDHRNGVRSDNRIANLRLATGEQNRLNRCLNANSSSGFKGVREAKDKVRPAPFRAVISHRNKKINLGYFLTAEEAHEAYCKAARELHGEFAKFS